MLVLELLLRRLLVKWQLLVEPVMSLNVLSFSPVEPALVPPLLQRRAMSSGPEKRIDRKEERILTPVETFFTIDLIF